MPLRGVACRVSPTRTSSAALHPYRERRAQWQRVALPTHGRYSGSWLPIGYFTLAGFGTSSRILSGVAKTAIAGRSKSFCTSHGVGATELHAHQFDIIKDTVDVGTVFRPGVFVRLFRRDKLRQAISLVRARPKRYHHHWPFNGRNATMRQKSTKRSTNWSASTRDGARYFARNGVEPVTLEYEAASVKSRWSAWSVSQRL